MAAARYWRMVGIETYAGGDLELSALHLYSADTRVDATATLTSSHAPIAGTLANLQDDSTATVCRFAGAAVRSAGFALVWDFGAGNAFDITAIRPGAGGDKAAFLASCWLQSSADGIAWSYVDRSGRYPWPGASAMCAMAWRNGDPYFDNVVALLHFDGAHGSTTFTDVKGHTFTAYGNAQLDASQSKFGWASGLFDGSGDWVISSVSADFGMGAGDYTIEGWCRPTANSGKRLLVETRISGSTTVQGIGIYSSQGGEAKLSVANSSAVIANSTNEIPLNTLRYIAVARKDGALRGFIDGHLEFSVMDSRTLAASTSIIFGGSSLYGEQDFAGSLDEWRITKGVARYTESFTPPNAPFPNSTNGVFSVAFDDPITHTTRSRPAIAASATVPSHTTRSTARLQMARDVEVGGQGTIYGTTKAAGAQGAPGIPTKARVVLLHQRSKLPVRETWSDPVTGNYAFTSIDTRQQFLVLAEDAQGAFRPVAANRLTPEVQP